MSSVEDELKENLARSSTLNTEQLIETVCCLRSSQSLLIMFGIKREIYLKKGFEFRRYTKC